MVNKNWLWGVLAFAAILSLLIITNGNEVSGIPLTMYKSPSCGCCVGNSKILQSDGFGVKIFPVEDMQLIKSKYNIPYELESCHTSIVEEYFVEGHVPTEAIDKLLAEKPDIDGIALPGMPAGSPGMPGYKNGEWIIYSVKDGKYSEFMRI